MSRLNPFKFLQQVRLEGSKVSWPTRNETLVTSLMVFIMTLITALFFLLVDFLIRSGVTSVLSYFS